MNIRHELEVLVDIIPSVVFIDIHCGSCAEEPVCNIRLHIDGEIFLSEDDKRHVLGIDIVDIYERSFLAIIISGDVLLEKGSQFLILVL